MLTFFLGPLEAAQLENFHAEEDGIPTPDLNTLLPMPQEMQDNENEFFSDDFVAQGPEVQYDFSETDAGVFLGD